MQDDRVDATTRGFLGLTVACATCHDHKFDPIPQSDYYSLLGIFANTSLSQMPLAPKEQVTAYDAAKKKVDDKKKEIDDFVKQQAASLSENPRLPHRALHAGRHVSRARYRDRRKSGRSISPRPQKEHPYLKAWFAAKTPEEKNKSRPRISNTAARSQRRKENRRRQEPHHTGAQFPTATISARRISCRSNATNLSSGKISSVTKESCITATAKLDRFLAGQWERSSGSSPRRTHRAAERDAAGISLSSDH